MQGRNKPDHRIALPSDRTPDCTIQLCTGLMFSIHYERFSPECISAYVPTPFINTHPDMHVFQGITICSNGNCNLCSLFSSFNFCGRPKRFKMRLDKKAQLLTLSRSDGCKNYGGIFYVLLARCEIVRKLHIILNLQPILNYNILMCINI